MSDDELMEAAARAAGLVLLARFDGRYMVHDGSSDSAWEWNPLTDDCDALWLAVTLRMRVTCIESGAIVQIQGVYRAEEFGSDFRAATRSAIVRAAAALGSENAAAPHTAAHLR